MVWFLVATLSLVAIGFGVLIYLFTIKVTPDPELMMGLLVVFSITTLMTVLFILAAGFNLMRLTDEKQALGLPRGSIRAMISLVLIMVFIIFGIFLFRKVGVQNRIYVGSVKQASDVKIPEGAKMSFLLESIPP